MMKIGVLRNPLSAKNKKRPHWPLPDGVVLVETSAEKAIAQAARELANEDLDLLLIDGGDGTITATISTFVAADTPLPPMGFIANGNTNLIARKAGKPLTREDLNTLSGMPVETLRRHQKRAPFLSFTIAGQEPRCGFIAGWGAYAKATRMAVEEMRSRRDLQIATAIVATLRRTLFGKEARSLRDGIECRFQTDDSPIIEAKRFVGVVTSLQGRLAAGVKPFWGNGTGPMRWLDVTSPPRYHILLAPFVLFGLALPILARLGYRSGRATRLSVTLSDVMIIDGEIISLSPETRIDIDANRQLDLLHL